MLLVTLRELVGITADTDVGTRDQAKAATIIMYQAASTAEGACTTVLDVLVLVDRVVTMDTMAHSIQAQPPAKVEIPQHRTTFAIDASNLVTESKTAQLMGTTSTTLASVRVSQLRSYGRTSSPQRCSASIVPTTRKV